MNRDQLEELAHFVDFYCRALEMLERARGDGPIRDADALRVRRWRELVEYVQRIERAAELRGRR